MSELPKVDVTKILDFYEVRYVYRSGFQKTLCVFHDESQPSMVIDIDSGSFSCFSCGAKGGDAIQFVRVKENLSFPETLKKVEEITGTKMNSRGGGDHSPRRVKKGHGFRPKFRGSLLG